MPIQECVVIDPSAADMRTRSLQAFHDNGLLQLVLMHRTQEVPPAQPFNVLVAIYQAARLPGGITSVGGPYEIVLDGEDGHKAAEERLLERMEARQITHDIIIEIDPDTETKARLVTI